MSREELKKIREALESLKEVSDFIAGVIEESEKTKQQKK